MNFTVLHFDTLASTNTEAAEQARRGADEGTCIVADEQTAGRGRQGREWVSQKDTGLFMSLILRPKVESTYLTLIPLLAAVAVHDVLLNAFQIESDIKWPNDILVRENKICGILAEAVDTPNGLAVVLGIGVNLMGDLPNMATSIERESHRRVSHDHMIGGLTKEIAALYEMLSVDPAGILAAWRERSSYFAGKDVEVRSGEEIFTGVTCGLEENGALRVQSADGLLRVVQAGDVQRLRSAY